MPNHESCGIAQISEQTVPLYVPGTGQRVKGKQVEVLHDLVTVSGERTARMPLMLSIGKAAVRGEPQVRKPAVLLVREAASGSRVIDCTDTA